MTEAYPGHELVRFGNFFDRLEIAAAVDEGESLARGVRPRGRYRHLARRPGMTLLGADAPTRRHAVLEDLDGDNAVPGIDAANFLPVAMSMTVHVIVAVMSLAGSRLGSLLILPGPPQHPNRD